MNRKHPPPAPGLRFALEMHEFGVQLMRQNLRRRHPLASEVELERMLTKWLHDKTELGGPDLCVTWFDPVGGECVERA